MRNRMKPSTPIVIVSVALAMLAVSGCTKAVDIDKTATQFTKFLVPGACQVQPGDTQTIDISTLMLNGPDPILPDTRLTREIKPVEEIVRAEDYLFTPIADEANETETNAIGRLQESGERVGIDLKAEQIRFEWTGGDERKNDERLVILLLDHSGSLAGIDPRTGNFAAELATDRNDQRISFFQQLVRSFPDDWFVSLVSFNGSFVNVTQEFSTPTRNRQVIQEGLDELETGENGLTPLADALEAARCRVAGADGNSDLNPMIILFTDGVEEGDNSTAQIGDVTDALAGGGACANGATPGPIPVTVMQLQPRATSGLPLGRDWDLVNLACRTGGDHIFLEEADELTGSQDLPTMVRTRVYGAWKLRTLTTLGRQEFDPGAWALSTELTVTLGTVEGERQSKTARLARSESTADDGRLWLLKE